MIESGSSYEQRIAELHRELGIPTDYARQHGLKHQPEANLSDLVAISHQIDGIEVVLTPAAAASWHRLCTAATKDGVTLVPISGFRSVSRQVEIIRHKLRNRHLISDILVQIAAPGFSEHHTGYALDIGSPDDPPLEQSFAQTHAFRWLNDHASCHGWRLSYAKENIHGIIFEPWHYLHKP